MGEWLKGRLARYKWYEVGNRKTGTESPTKDREEMSKKEEEEEEDGWDTNNTKVE